MQTVSNITAIPNATAMVPIFTIGLEIVLLLRMPSVIRFAIKRSADTLLLKESKNTQFIVCILLLVLSLSLKAQSPEIKAYTSVSVGIAQPQVFLPLLKQKRVAVVTNISGQLNGESTVDILIRAGVKVKKVFGPEHGFRGDTEAGEKVNSQTDKKTGLPVISLYGKNKKPRKEDLKDIDIVVYDIQDIGVRFYTYISTMAYVMEACAENKKRVIIMDRPNPNGFYIDGPVLQKEWKSFLGLHPVPLVYGMTCGEYAQMINGEKWLNNGVQCQLTVIPLKNYDRCATYDLPVKPSPNIPNHNAVLLYPTLGLFEGSMVSMGRGTPFPFQVIGYPSYTANVTFSFQPKPGPLSQTPKYVNQTCYGIDLRESGFLKQHPKTLQLEWLKTMLKACPRDTFFDKNFNYHAGNATLKSDLLEGKSTENIRQSWQNDIEIFKKIRKNYLLYPDVDTCH